VGTGLQLTAKGMFWSLSEFLNQFEFRSQSWCIAEIGAGHAIRIPTADVAYFYALLDGTLSIYGAGSRDVVLKPDGVIIVLSGKSHLLSFSTAPHRQSIPLLQDGGYVDSPPTIVIGAPPFGARVLCGRLKVRWPTGKRPAALPEYLQLNQLSQCVDVARFVQLSGSEGGAALLTHLANLLFVTAFRESAECVRLFSGSGEQDPVDRARRYIELHPTHAWTVDILAKKVGMSRSHLAARFVSQFGKTPIDMLIEERMKLAAQLLEDRRNQRTRRLSFGGGIPPALLNVFRRAAWSISKGAARDDVNLTTLGCEPPCLDAL
jgi:AraC family transcriptional regulator, alkane utilization regulator